MKAMVLAAGRATRLRPLTDAIAKPALPFVGRTILDRVLDGLAEADVSEAVVNLHHAPDSVREVVAARGRALPRVTFSDETAELLGTGGALIPVRDLFWREETFLLVNGDCVHSVDYRALLAAHRASGASATLAVRPHAEPGFGGLRTDGAGAVEAFSVRPADDPRDRHFLSVQAVDPRLLDLLPEEPRALSAFTEWYAPALEEGHAFRVHETDAEWHALDSRELYLAATRAWLERRGVERWIDERARVAGRARVGTGCAVHSGARLEDGAVVERSVVLDGAVLGPGARIVDSVIGPDAEVAEGARVEAALVASP